MNESLLRQVGVDRSKTDLATQTSTLAFKPGEAIDFGKLAKAVDTAGFTVGDIKVWATGRVEVAGGQLLFRISGSEQALLLLDNDSAAKLKDTQGKEIKVTGKVDFKNTPAKLEIESFQMWEDVPSGDDEKGDLGL